MISQYCKKGYSKELVGPYFAFYLFNSEALKETLKLLYIVAEVVILFQRNLE